MLPNEDKLTNSIRTLPYDNVMEAETTDPWGFYHKSRVITPLSPVIVRQEGPQAPEYQEARGYTFLLNAAGFPGLARMDDGTLVLTLNAQKGLVAGEREEFLLFSEDEGQSWSQPRRIPGRRVKPFNLGGDKLMLRGSYPVGDEGAPADCLCFSEVGGQTWGDPELVPKLPGDRQFHISDLAYTFLIEDNTITFVGWSPPQPGHTKWKDGRLFTQGVLRRYHLDTHTWDEPHFMPKDWALNEGSLIRTANGNLVAAFRTQMVGVPVHSDHEMGMATLWSSDNGKTWSEPAHHFLYGYHHCGLIMLADGRILLTYVVRIGELDGMTYHGVEAVVSRDHGVTWDWDHRYILSRWPHPSTHSPQSVCLSNQQILTVFMHDTRHSWTDLEGHPYKDKLTMSMVAHVSVIIWSVD